MAKQIKANGLEGKKVAFSKKALLTVIRRYTREAGVRNLEREIASICRKLAREAVNDKEKTEFVVGEKSVSKYLGVFRFRQEEVDAQDQVGMVTGLAWTPVGGELLFIETLLMPGRGQLTVTGKLGEVMQESAHAALSYVRSRADHLMIDEKFHRKYDIHIHIPEGAIPKDGPSAGISMCTSLVSALTKRPVHRDIAMTGEISLREVIAGKETDVGNVRVATGGRVQGYVFDADGTPVEGARVLLMAGEDAVPNLEAGTDAHGAYTLAGVPLGVNLVPRTEDPRVSGDAVAFRDPGEVQRRDIRFPALATLTVTVRGPDGESVELPDVYLEHEGRRIWQRSRDWSFEAPPGRYLLTVRPFGWPSLSREVVLEAGGSHKEIVLRAASPSKGP